MQADDNPTLFFLNEKWKVTFIEKQAVNQVIKKHLDPSLVRDKLFAKKVDYARRILDSLEKKEAAKEDILR